MLCVWHTIPIVRAGTSFATASACTSWTRPTARHMVCVAHWLQPLTGLMPSWTVASVWPSATRTTRQLSSGVSATRAATVPTTLRCLPGSMSSTPRVPFTMKALRATLTHRRWMSSHVSILVSCRSISIPAFQRALTRSGPRMPVGNGF